ncbi:MAG: hypothetical protein IKO35_02460, partial [Elusimicrobiaceae bacterium]|nr:hypothetical protein [Elusimicrobiaceae bacterium]
MKKIITLLFALGMVSLVPGLAQAADDCGCAVADVTCTNNCTLSKVSTLRKNIQNNKEAAKANATAKAKANKEAAKVKAKQAKADAAAKKAEAKAKANQAKADAAAKKAEAKAKANQ